MFSSILLYPIYIGASTISTKIGTTSLTHSATSYRDTSIESARTYIYRVSTNRSGHISDPSSIAVVVSTLLEEARRAAARSVNAILTATYWEIGRQIVVFEQEGQERATYGSALLKRLSSDLVARFGRGFSERNLPQMRLFYQHWPISQTVSAKSVLDILETSEEATVYPAVMSNPEALLELLRCPGPTMCACLQ